LELYDQVELSIRAYERYFKNKIDLTKDDFEFKVLNYGKKLLSTIDEKNTLREFRNYLIADGKKGVFSGLDELFVQWIESKLQRKSIAQTISESNVKVAG